MAVFKPSPHPPNDSIINPDSINPKDDKITDDEVKLWNDIGSAEEILDNSIETVKYQQLDEISRKYMNEGKTVLSAVCASTDSYVTLTSAGLLKEIANVGYVDKVVVAEISSVGELRELNQDNGMVAVPSFALYLPEDKLTGKKTDKPDIIAGGHNGKAEENGLPSDWYRILKKWVKSNVLDENHTIDGKPAIYRANNRPGVSLYEIK